MTPAERPIPAAPCPTCQRPLEARSGEVGHVVRCAGCGTRFRITLATTVAPLPEEDDLEDSPAKTRPRTANPYDDGYARFEATVTPGRIVALATMHFVYCGLLSVCGILSSVLLRVYPTALPGPDVAPGNRVFTHSLHFLMIAASVLFLVAGLTALRRRNSFRIWSIVGISVAVLLLLLSLGDLILNLPQVTGLGGGAAGSMLGLVYLLFFWLGYIVPVSVLLASNTREGDPRITPEESYRT